jgi:hypothetical protein
VKYCRAGRRRAAPASPSGSPAPPEAPRFPTHAHTPRRLGVSPCLARRARTPAPAGPSRDTLLRACRARLAPYRGVNGRGSLTREALPPRHARLPYNESLLRSSRASTQPVPPQLAGRHAAWASCGSCSLPICTASQRLG